jgi:SMODS-associated and fused to various effectors sensor domain
MPCTQQARVPRPNDRSPANIQSLCPFREPAPIVDSVRTDRASARRAAHGHPRVYLFLATPMGLALLLGHRWNRIAPTTVY